MECKCCEHYHGNKYCDVLDLCPCYPDKGCDFAESRKGLINKQDVLDILGKGEKELDKLIRIFRSLKSDEERMFRFGLKLVRACIRDVKGLPPAQRKGKWIVLDECANEGVYCSECHKKVFKIDYSNTMKWKNFNFCPNCGADMRGGEDG